uniref:Predicted protein n=1 Tax=Hordeum vulgare subsp. vulgare TaxID=112509 RepID=F2E1U1_HORVV|nr:predicted protein [Hordeum vulgare subsp. vulgare]
MEILEEGETYLVGNRHRDEYSFDDLSTFRTKKYFKISQVSLNWFGDSLAGIQVDYQNVLTRGYISTDWHCTLLRDSKVTLKKETFSLEPHEYIVRIQAVCTETNICSLGFLTSANRVFRFGAESNFMGGELVDLVPPEGCHFNYVFGAIGLLDPIIRNLQFETVEIPKVKLEMKEEYFDIAYDLNKIAIKG